MSNDQRGGGFDCGCSNFGYGGGSKSIGAILVLFILLVIIASAFCNY